MFAPANQTHFSLTVEGLSSDLQVVSLSGREAISQPFVFDVELVSERPALGLETLLHKPAFLQLSPDGSGIHGQIYRVAQGETGQRLTRYAVTLRPQLSYLAHRFNPRIFQNRNVPTIIGQVLEEQGIQRNAYQFVLGSAYPDREYCVQYDNARLLLSDIKNERGELYHLDYYTNGLIRQETGFDGRRTAYEYDLNGQLLKKTEFGDDDSERTTHYQRDAAGRLLVKTLADGEPIHYRYDAFGRLVNVDDGHWPLAYEYDLQDRLITEHQGWGTTRYEYDILGQLSHCRLPDGSTVDYRHQPGGQLSSIDLNGSRLTTHQFNAGLERQRQQGMLLSQYQYDEQGRLQAHSVSQQERNLYRRRYTYDVNGNLAGINDSRKGNRSFHYDPLDRLVNVRGTTPESFAHDPAGNLLGQAQQVAASVANIKGNRLLMHGDRHYDYDAYGNQIPERRGTEQKLVTEYRYDGQHRLIGVTLPDGSTASYRYDAFGRRSAKTVEGHTTEFLW